MAASTHPDFPNGMEVINIRVKSRFFGHRGVVYGSGASKTNPSPYAVIFVRWPSGETYKYFPKALGVAPLRESEYRTSTNTRDGKKVTIHKIPACRRGRPTLAQLVAARSTKAEES